MMSKKSQTVKSFQTDNVRAPFKCDIMVLKGSKRSFDMNIDSWITATYPQHKLITSLSKSSLTFVR